MKKADFGKLIIHIDSFYVSSALDAILKNFLEYEHILYHSDGSIDIRVLASDREKFKQAFNDNSIEARYGKSNGILPFLFRYTSRFGIIAGIIIMLLCVFLSSKTVWDINIIGNSTVSNEEILDELKRNGFNIGAYVPSIDFDKLHNNFLLNSDSVAWISINMDGNTANVNIREIKEDSYADDKYYSNVVARYDGQIALIKKYNGVKTVNILDTVKKGDILISGIIDSKSQGVRYIHAEGEVEAYVKKQISVKVPLKTSVKTYTGRKTTDRSIEIFSKNINILKNSGNLYNNYDTIESYENIKLFGTVELPIRIKETIYTEYKYEDVQYSKNQARDIAMSKLRNETDEALSKAELISRKINHFCDFEFYYIECELYCYEDIAEIVKFELNGK